MVSERPPHRRLCFSEVDFSPPPCLQVAQTRTPLAPIPDNLLVASETWCAHISEPSYRPAYGGGILKQHSRLTVPTATVKLLYGARFLAEAVHAYIWQIW